MELNQKTVIYDLLEAHPNLVNVLADINPHFNNLRNPVLRNTMARVATLETAAGIAGMPVEELIAKLNAAIASQAGGEPHAKPGSSSVEPDKVQRLKVIIKRLHAGEDAQEVKQKFSELVEGVAPHEIAAMEQQLMREGMPEGEIKRLCDVHVAMFRESLEQVSKPEAMPGHPVHTFMQENYELQKRIGKARSLVDRILQDDRPSASPLWVDLGETVAAIGEVEKHYLRKEYQLFPFLEKKGFTGPSQVMWSIHDDIRALFKRVKEMVANRAADELNTTLNELLRQVEEMFFKEERILFPVSMELLSDADWAQIREGGREFGYAHLQPVDLWQPRGEVPDELKAPPMPDRLPLDTGLMSLEQLNLMLMHLPLEISFVDDNDEVRYYTHKADKIFPRSPGVIGRKVQNCHPPKSLDKVNEILARFRDGSRDHADFWIQMAGKFLHIRYFAVRDGQGKYKGTLETVQDVTDIKRLEGERRLLEWS